MIDLKNVTKKYNDLVVLDKVNLSFNNGLIGIVGCSGEGKSTLLNLISALDNDYDGDILFNGKNYRDFKDKENFRYQNFGFIFQSPILFNLLSVIDNICYDQEQNYINKQKVKEVLDKVGLNISLNEKVSHLSGGEKQRLSIARSLFHDAKIILCDEPTGALDSFNKEKIMDLLREVSKTRLVIVVSHEKDLLEKYVNEIYELKNKKINLIFKNNRKLKKHCLFENKENKLNIKLMLEYIKKNLKIKKFRSLISFFSIGLGLFSIGISSLITTIVSKNIETNLLSEFEKDKYFIKSKEIHDDGFNEIYSSPYEKVLNIQEDIDEAKYVGTFYFSSFESQMVDNNYFYLNINDFITSFSELNIRSINEYKIIDEKDVIYPRKPIYLSNDEFILCLRKKDIRRICQNLHLDNYDEESLSTYLKSNSLSFTYVGENVSWSYQVEVDLKCKYFIIGDELSIYHTSYFWNEYIFEEKMQLIPTNDLLAYSYLPWTIKKTYYLKVDENNQINILKNLLFNKKYNNYHFDFIDKNNSKILSRDNKKTGRIYVTNQTKNRFNIGEIKENLDESFYYFSNDITYYVYEKMLINGFVNPTFLIKDEDKLISIIDEFSISEEDLITMNLKNDEICYSSLASIMEENQLKFENYGNSNFIYGRKSFNYQEIVISSSIAKQLFNNLSLENVLHQNIYFLNLSNSYNEKDLYHNTFEYVKLKIVGIVDSDKFIIYGDELWTSLFYIDNFSCSVSDLNPIYCVSENDNVLLNENYQIIDPFIDVINNMNNLLYYVNLGFSAFSIISVSSAILMNVIILYLFIDDNKKEIALMIALGISKKYVLGLFVLFSLVIGLCSFIYSVFSLFVSNIFLSFELSGSLSYFSLNEFIISSSYIFVIMLAISIIIGFISIKNILKEDVLISLKEK